MHATPECNRFLPLTDVAFNFVPVDDTTSTLVQTDYGMLRFIVGTLVEIAGDQQPDPRHYTLTTKAGFKYVLDQEVGIKMATDPNGNTLTYTGPVPCLWLNTAKFNRCDLTVLRNTLHMTHDT